VGSGASSAAMMDVNDLFLEKAINFTFIEPDPERLVEMVGSGKLLLWRKPVQDVPLEVFADLHENDILFVDGSHVVKAGSDVGHIIFEVLPELKPGVLVHFHDVFYPSSTHRSGTVRAARGMKPTYCGRFCSLTTPLRSYISTRIWLHTTEMLCKRRHHCV
jgi:hypothetical protein